MVIDARSPQAPDTFETDICIVGAGAAGLAVAGEFVGSDIRVLVIESGGESDEPAPFALNDMECVGLNPRRQTGESRNRQLGGTTNRWGGWSRPFSNRVLADWPIPQGEIARYAARTEHLLELRGGDHDDITQWAQFPDQSFVSYGPGILAGVREVRALNVWEKLRKSLTESANITVVSHASVTGCDFSHGRDSLASMTARTLTGRKVTVMAQHYVLACGGLETPVLLLNIDRAHDGLLARKTDTIGRYYSDHADIHGEYIPLKCFIPALYQRFGDDASGPFYHWTRHCLALDPESEPSAASMPHGVVHAPFHAHCEYRNEWQYHNLHERIRQPDANFTVPKTPEEAADTSVVPDLVILSSGTRPNPESRITLSGKTNILGQFMGKLDWRIADDQVRAVLELALAIERRWGANGLARMRLSRIVRERGILAADGVVENSCHHMGGTRMAYSPRDGVVDPSLRFHGLKNLYIAGSGVFPSFDWPGPTYTAVALGLRLADLLKGAVGP